ncbi:hypothetical protein [Microbacterium esteraromaticum]|uniref:hypothetical protein n=1 Tax=Microbacterium esteraromaticum TaxID=57043 RepID=UPI0019D34720|nr:hypothetical protein [Microbacterium esteraromaticum]MBN7794261.1 hypothetical protein [Microbacterium esteraromaticum]
MSPSRTSPSANPADFTSDWTVNEILDHYAAHDALPSGLTADTLQRVDDALSPQQPWRRPPHPVAVIRSLGVRVRQHPPTGVLRVAQLIGSPDDSRAPAVDHTMVIA